MCHPGTDGLGDQCRQFIPYETFPYRRLQTASQSLHIPHAATIARAPQAGTEPIRASVRLVQLRVGTAAQQPLARHTSVPPLFCATMNSMVPPVCRPTTPSTGSRQKRWKFCTAVLVLVP